MSKLNRFLLILIFVLALGNLFVTNTFTGHGQAIADLETEILDLKHQNLKLELQLAQAMSLTHLAPQLAARDFQVPHRITGLPQQPSSVAMR